MARPYEILSLNLMAVMLCVEMQPETLCVSHHWSDTGFIGTQSAGTM